jgi:hypothetical protein
MGNRRKKAKGKVNGCPKALSDRESELKQHRLKISGNSIWDRMMDFVPADKKPKPLSFSEIMERPFRGMWPPSTIPFRQ